LRAAIDPVWNSFGAVTSRANRALTTILDMPTQPWVSRDNANVQLWVSIARSAASVRKCALRATEIAAHPACFRAPRLMAQVDDRLERADALGSAASGARRGVSWRLSDLRPDRGYEAAKTAGCRAPAYGRDPALTNPLLFFVGCGARGGGRRVIRSEAAAVVAPRARSMRRSCRARRRRSWLPRCRVIVAGVGSPGSSAGRIAATLTSTGTNLLLSSCSRSRGRSTVTRHRLPRLCRPPVLSQSGEAEELRDLLACLQALRRDPWSVFDRDGPTSTSAVRLTSCLDCGVDEEAVPTILAPTCFYQPAPWRLGMRSQ